MTTPHFADEPDPSVLDASAVSVPRRERLRFTHFSFKRTQSAYCTAFTELEWQDGEKFTGTAEGVSNPVSDLRLAVEATLRALGEFVKEAVTLELLGVKALRVFDANVVIVSILAKVGGAEHRLLGCHVANDDPLRSAALATLQATNRIVGAPLQRM
jgi:hypothetical protein